MASETGDRAKRLVREFLAAILFFITGTLFLLLTALGPVFFGPAFDGGYLNWVGAGLVIVSVYVTVGINLPRLLQGQRDFRRKEDQDADSQ